MCCKLQKKKKKLWHLLTSTLMIRVKIYLLVFYFFKKNLIVFHSVIFNFYTHFQKIKSNYEQIPRKTQVISF